MEGMTVRFDLEAGWIEAGGTRSSLRPLSQRMLDILRAGGLVEYWRVKQ